DRLGHLLESRSGVDALATLKFGQFGCDPLDGSRPLNLVEQLNQSFTYLASLEAVRWLLEHHPEHGPYTLNLGTASGIDIESHDGAVAAETFAATTPESNRKLKKDIDKLRGAAAPHRYVFYLSAVRHSRAEVEGVRIVALDHECMASYRSIEDA